VAAFGARLPLGAARTIAPTRDRAAALAALARTAWSRGEGVDAAEAVPLYLRDKVALTTAEREASRASAGSA
jgi:tRNA threonylcarbamoyladenosine biosynthesis protein TsaB